MAGWDDVATDTAPAPAADPWDDVATSAPTTGGLKQGAYDLAGQLQHPLGVMARKVIEGGVSTLDLPENVINLAEAGMDKLTGKPQSEAALPTPFTSGADKLMDMANQYAMKHGGRPPYPEASTGTEKVLGGIASGISSGAGIAGKIGALGGGLAEGTNTALNVLGAPPSVQLAGGLAAGMLPSSALGAAIDVGHTALSTVKNFMNPASEANIGKVLASGMDNPDAVLNRLQAPGPKDIIPGSKPTMAEVAKDNKLVGTQKAFENVNPGVLSTERNANNAARNTAFDSIPEATTDVPAAKTARAAATQPLYAAAKQDIVTPQSVQPVLDQIDAAIKETGVQTDAGQELVSLRNKIMGTFPDDPTVAGVKTGPLVQLYRETRDKLASSMQEQGGYAQAVREHIYPINSALGDAIEAQSNNFKQAQQVYAQQSGVINRAQTLQDIKFRSQTAPKNTLGENTFSQPKLRQILENPDSRSELARSLTPEQMRKLDAINSDLSRQSQMESVRPTNSATAGNTAAKDRLQMIIDKVANSKFGQVPFIGKDILDRGQKAMQEGLRASYADPYGAGAKNLAAGLQAIKNQASLTEEVKKSMMASLLGSSIGQLSPADANYLKSGASK